LTLQVFIFVNARVQQIYKYAHARMYAHKQANTATRARVHATMQYCINTLSTVN